MSIHIAYSNSNFLKTIKRSYFILSVSILLIFWIIHEFIKNL